MNRQVAFAYATAGVAASVAAIVTIGSAFGFGDISSPATGATELSPAVAAVVSQLPPDELRAVLDQRDAAQAAVAAEVEAQRDAALAELEQQIADQQQRAAADLQQWVDQQQQLALQDLATSTPAPLVAHWYGDDDDDDSHERYEHDDEYEDHDEREWDDD